MNERQLIDYLQQNLEKPDYLHSWMNEDCEIIDLGDEDLHLATIDTSSEGQDFPSDAPPFGIGYYSAALSLSDIAACGGKPIGMLVSCSIPEGFSDNIVQIYDGINQAAQDAETSILGGDTNSAGELSLSIVSLGLVGRERILRRGGARIGDLVAVSGPLDRYNFGHYNYANSKEIDFKNMLIQPPPLKFGRVLTQLRGVTSCIDTPDGLIKALEDNMPSDAGYLIDDDRIPISRFNQDYQDKVNKPNYVLSTDPAGDLELLFTVDPDQKKAVEHILRENNLSIYWIGNVVERCGIQINMENKIVQPTVSGFVHSFDRQLLFPKH